MKVDIFILFYVFQTKMDQTANTSRHHGRIELRLSVLHSKMGHLMKPDMVVALKSKANCCFKEKLNTLSFISSLVTD
jgi:hypothetical protein